MLGTAEQDAFVSRSLIAIVTTLRADGTPSNSIVSFARREDCLLFSTTIRRLKGKTLARDPQASLTVLNPHEPWSYVSIEGRVTIHRDNPAELRKLMLDCWIGNPDYIWSREEVEPMMVAPGRAVFELEPARVSGALILPS